MIYCDTSFLLSLYVEDSGSEFAIPQMAKASEQAVWTQWHRLEFTTALEARVGRKANTRGEVNLVQAAVADHLKDGLFLLKSVDWEKALARSSELSAKWAANLGCRSLDILHVGICLELGIKKFWSLDQRQLALAKSAGLKTNKSR